MGEATERYAVVTGANKGIGLEIVRQLASEGIKVVLTARNEERGLQALETLKASGLSHLLLFHQIDVAHAASVAAFADFIKSKFGKLDILVNNAGINGVVIEDRDLFTTVIVNRGVIPDEEATRAVTQTYELAEECLQINYYGTKITIESLMPLLQLSDSPRIVNVSSTLGQLEVSFNLLEKYLEAHSKASMWENELLDVGYQPLCIQIPYTLEAFQPGKRGAVVGLVEEKHFILLS